MIAGYSSGEINAYRYENGRTLWGDALSRTSISTAVADARQLVLITKCQYCAIIQYKLYRVI